MYGANDRNLEPLILELQYDPDGGIQSKKTVIRHWYEPVPIGITTSGEEASEISISDTHPLK